MYYIVINPTSGNGCAQAYLPQIESTLRSRNIDYAVLKTSGHDSTIQIIRDICRAGADAIVAVGGDGTFFDIANGIIRNDIPVIFVSCGTGNDFVKSLGLPKDPIEALRLQLDLPIGNIDIGAMNEYRFLNVSGTGFDVDVLRKAESFKGRFRGLLTYLFGLFEAFKHYTPNNALVSFDEESEKAISFSIISVGNGRYFGGGMKPVPNALVNDGLFDVVVVKPVRKVFVLPLLFFFIPGIHLKLGLGYVRRCRKVSIRLEGMTINMDGELRNTDYAEYSILEKAMTVRLPGIK